VKILKTSFIDFDVSSSQVYDRFNALIKRMSYLIDMAKELANAISFVLLMQLFLSSILLCIMGEYFMLFRFYNKFIKHIKKLLNKERDSHIYQIFIKYKYSVSGFQFILAFKMNDIVMMGKSLTVLCTFLTQLTVYSFVGDYLKSQMEEVGLFIYQSVWYDLPEKLSKNLIFIIMRAQSPVKLQAGNFIVVNLATYMSILKTSMSYLSVLRVMVET